MRVAFISFEYPPFVEGGAGIYAKNITEELVKLGHEIVVFTPLIQNTNMETTIPNLQIRRIYINKKLPFFALQFWFKLPHEIKKAHQQEKFDLIHINSFSYWFLYGKLLDLPHIITVHHLTVDASHHNNPSIFERIMGISGENNLFMPHIEKRCIKYADKLISVSNYTKRTIIESCGVNSNKIEVIYNGLEHSSSNFTLQELETTKYHFNLHEKPILLFVGRVDDPRKGLDFAIRTLKMIVETIDVVLLVVGKGNQKKAKKLAGSLGVLENIIFTGYIDHNLLKKCYSLCNIYICPSRLEGFGLTIIEAMIAKKPVVATNVGAIPEIIDDGFNGILVEFGDINGMSSAICKFLRNQKLAREIGEHNWVYANENFSWTENVNLLDSIYRKKGYK